MKIMKMVKQEFEKGNIMKTKYKRVDFNIMKYYKLQKGE